MNGANFNEVLDLIIREDSRYDRNAYYFMRKALDHTLKSIQDSEQKIKSRHVTGQELCEGIRRFALDQYGPMTLTLLNNWGVFKTQDFGNIVFNLVEYGVFGKTEKDSHDDFIDVFDFGEAFTTPFLPRSKRKTITAEQSHKSDQ